MDLPPAIGVEYMKTVAVSRIFRYNIKYIQAGRLVEGMKLAQMARDMGANNMSGVLMGKVVVNTTGVRTRTNVEEWKRSYYKRWKNTCST